MEVLVQSADRQVLDEQAHLHFGGRVVLTHHFGESKISQFGRQIAIDQKNVFRLDVSMNNVSFVLWKCVRATVVGRADKIDQLTRYLTPSNIWTITLRDSWSLSFSFRRRY
jgi:hypothetical protein